MPKEIVIKECVRHGMTEHYKRIDGGNRNNSFRCAKCNVENVSNSRRNIKKRLIDEFGGKCQRCGYDRCYKALQFHHKDREVKTFTIGSGNYRSWKSALAEAKKCELLCANCHFEVEADLYEEQCRYGASGNTSAL